MLLNVSTLSPSQYQLRSCIRSLLCGASIDQIKREIEVREDLGDAFGRLVALDYLEETITDEQ